MERATHSGKDAKPLEVAAAVIVRDEKLLITQRLKKSHLGHLWEFPGGKIERGETPFQCVIRECQEEIDAYVKPLKLLREMTHQYPQVSLKLYFVLCRLLEGEPRVVECADLRWVSPAELRHFPFPEADLEVIRHLNSSDFIYSIQGIY